MPNSGTFADYVGTHPDTLALLDLLRQKLAEVGPTTETFSKSQVTFTRDRVVAHAWAPGQYREGRGAPLVLTIGFPERDPSPRWKEIVHPSPNWFTHHLELTRAEDLDDEVAAWLRTAWEAAARGE